MLSLTQTHPATILVQSLRPSTRVLVQSCELLVDIDDHIYIGCYNPVVSYRILRRTQSIANVANRIGVGVTLCDPHNRLIQIA
jgi:hypothetical protein